MGSRKRNVDLQTPKTPTGASAGLPTIDTSKLTKEGKLICECLMSSIISYFDAKLADKEQLINDLSSSVEKLKKRVVLLEEVVDDNQAHERRDTLVLSGDIPEVRADEDCNVLVRTLLTEETGVTISEADISVAHRIGKKRNRGPDKRSVIFKLCRRDVKGKIMTACKEKKPDQFFVNESLTPTRNTIMYVLRRAKKKHPSVFGNIRSQLGACAVVTAVSSGGPRATCGTPPPAANYTNEQYLGYWYEMGRVQTFGGSLCQIGCMCSVSYFETEELYQGGGNITYACRKFSPDAEPTVASAELVYTGTPGFFNQVYPYPNSTILNYYIIYIDKDSAVEYDCGTDDSRVTNYCVHILSRTPSIDPVKLQQLLDYSESLGLNPNGIEYNPISHGSC